MREPGHAPTRDEEAALARSAACGRRDAFGELVRRYERPLLRFLALRCRSPEDAEELCQETFLRAWTRIARYDPRWRFSTWLFTLARRLEISRRRSPRPEVQGAAVEELGVRAGPAEDAARRERDQGLWSLAERLLTGDQRTALWLRYAEGLSAVEIGHVLGRRAGAVRVLLHRARAALAERLDPTLAEAAGCAEERAPYLPALPAGQALEGGS